MSVVFSNIKAQEAADRVLSLEVDETDKVAVGKLRQSIINVANNIRTAIADGRIKDPSDELISTLRSMDVEAMRLQFSTRFDGDTKHPPLLGSDVDNEVMFAVAEACAVLGLSAPKGFTGNMFRCWGFMMGLVRQVNEVKKIGTGGFLALAKAEHLQGSAEYIVYHKAKEHGEVVTKHLGKGCMERIEEVLKEHGAI